MPNLRARMPRNETRSAAKAKAKAKAEAKAEAEAAVEEEREAEIAMTSRSMTSLAVEHRSGAANRVRNHYIAATRGIHRMTVASALGLDQSQTGGRSLARPNDRRHELVANQVFCSHLIVI